MKPHFEVLRGTEVTVRRVFGVIEWTPGHRRLALYLWAWRWWVIFAVYFNGDPNAWIRDLEKEGQQ